MAPTTAIKRSPHGVEKVRAHLLTSLHIGKLRPGDRILSVRRLAEMTGLNRKTVHRAYKALIDEGLLHTRPGSGTFVAEEKNEARRGEAGTGDLLHAVNRCRAEAAGLGLPSAMFVDFLSNFLGHGLRDLPVSVAECNHEQIDVIARELRGDLGLAPRPVLLSELQERSVEAVAGTWCIVTTDCHRAEVARVAAVVGMPVYRVALDPAFPRHLVECARRGGVVMVVQDASFAPVFLRLLRQLAVSEELVERFHIVRPEDAAAAFRATGRGGSVHVSPLLERLGRLRIPAHLKRISAAWPIASTSRERLRARLAFDLALRAHPS